METNEFKSWGGVPECYATKAGRRFLNKVSVDFNTGCWLWTATVSKRGYGYFGYKRNGTRAGIEAHRASYLLFAGDIPDGLVIDHLCRNKRCVNPLHLEAVTQKENVRRAPTKWATRELWFKAKERCNLGHPILGMRSNGVRYCKECKSLRRRAVK